MGFNTTILYLAVCNLLKSDEGQDLVEYALLLAIIALGAVIGMKSLVDQILNAYYLLAAAIRFFVGGGVA